MSESQWHLSKSVPISIIIGFVMQFMGALWMVSQMYAAIGSNTDRLNKHDTQIEGLRTAAQTQAVQLGRIETNISAMRKTLEDVARDLRDQR